MAVYTVSFSEYGARLVLNCFRGGGAGTSITAPTALYIALLTGTATDVDTGGGFTEFTGYSGTNRPAITFGAAAVAGASAPLTTAQRITSTNAPSFSITSSATISGIAITTVQLNTTALAYGATGGNVVWYGELTTGTPPSQTATTVAVVNTDTLTFSIGNITIDLY